MTRSLKRGFVTGNLVIWNLECNIVNKVFFGLSLNVKYLRKYFFGVNLLRITLLSYKILLGRQFWNKLPISAQMCRC